MVTFNYKLENFLLIPTNDDNTIKIYNKYNKLIYTINPNLAYFFYKNNLIIIKVDDEEDIILDFKTNQDAINALSKLNDAKKKLINNITVSDDYYLKTELNNGVLDFRYYTSAQTNHYFSQTGHSHSITGLTDVKVSGLTINNVLAYNGNEWVNSSFTFDLSAWQNNYYTSAQTNQILSGYSLTSHTHDDIYYRQEQFSGSTSGYSWDVINLVGGPKNDAILDYRYIPRSEFNYDFNTSGGGILDDRYYTQVKLYNKTEIDALLSQYTTTASTNNLKLEDLINVQSGATNKQIIVFDGSVWNSDNISNILNGEYYTSAQTNQILSGYSLTSHTHDSRYYQQSELFNSGETLIILSGYSLTSHTHDSRYATKTELTGGTLDWRYTTKIELTGGTLDWRYLLISNFNNTISNYSLTSHTHDLRYYQQSELYTSAQTDALLSNYLMSGISDARYLHYGDAYLTGNTYNKTEIDNLLNNYISLSGSNNISGHLIPSSNGVIDLGSATHQWRSLYVSSSTIYIDNKSISIDSNGNLIVDGNIISNSSHTHDDIYYRQEQFSGSSSGYTFAELSNGAINDAVLDWKGNDLTDVDNGRYFPVALFKHQSAGGDVGILDNRYYTKYALSAGTLDWKYLPANTLDIYYTSAQTDALLSGYTLTVDLESDYYDVTEINDILDEYYTSAQTDTLLSNYSLTSHTHDSRYYQQTVLYTSNEIDLMFSQYFNSAVSDARYIQSLELFDYWTSAETLTVLSGYSLTSHTHDSRYYTKTELDPNPGNWTGIGVLDSRYYVKSLVYEKTEIDNLLSNYYTSAQTNQIFYNSAQTNLILSGYSLTSHTHNINDLSDINIISINDNDILIYSGGSWINSALTLNNYYLKSELNNGVLDFRYYTSAQTNQIFYNSAQTDQILLNYYTSAQTNLILSGYSLTSHTHDDIYYRQWQFSGSSSGYSWDETNVVSGETNDAILDYRYIPLAQFNHTDPGHGGGILDSRYCTKVCLDGMFDNVYASISGLTLSGSNVLYTNYTPVPEDLGGVESGDIFPSGTTVQDVLDQLLYPYQYPSFTSFANGMSGISEIGTYIPGANHRHYWHTNNSSNIANNSIEISGYNLTTVTGLNNNSTNSGETNIYISGFTGLTNYSWTIKATNTNGDNFNRIINMNFKHKRYWGRTTYDISSFSGLTNSGKSNLLQGLNGAGVGVGSDFNSIKNTYNGIDGATQYLIFGYMIGSSPYTLQFKINGLPNTAWSYTDFTYTNSQGYNEIYRVYISDTAQNSPIALFEIF